MSDEIDIPEPEHDHLLDHEFHEEEPWIEEDAQAILDDEGRRTLWSRLSGFDRSRGLNSFLSAEKEKVLCPLWRTSLLPQARPGAR